jgi:hypothetical protein
MKKREHSLLLSRFKPGLGIWLCFFCAFLLPLSAFASNKGLVGHWPLSERNETLGSDLVTNGGFNDASWWTSTQPASVEISGGTANWDGTNSNGQGIARSNLLTVGKVYNIKWDIISNNGVDVRPYVGTYPSGSFQSIGTHEVTMTATTTHFYMMASSNLTGAVDNIIVKEVVTADATPNNNNGSVLNGPTYTAGRDGKGLGEELVTNGGFDTDTNWSKETGWTISGGIAHQDGSGSQTTNDIIQSALTIGKRYRVTFDILDYSAGWIYASINGGLDTSGQYSSNGTKVFTGTASGNTSLYFRPSSDFVGSIDNVSVREIISGQAMSFDGVDDLVSIPHSASNTLGNTGTISLWLKANTLVQDSFAGLISKATGGSVGTISYDIHWRDIANPDVIRFDIGDASALDSVTIPELDLNWHHLIFTWDGSNLYAYLDGLQAATTPQTITPVNLNTEVKIGGDTYSTASGEDDYFNGSISDVRIYDRALSATEVAQLYNGSESSASTGSLNKGLVGHWPLNTESKKSATVVADTTPQNNNGTLAGAVVRNHGYSFDGVDDYIDMGDNSSLDITDYMTLEAWVYINNANLGAGYSGIICKNDWSSSGKGYRFGYQESGSLAIVVYEESNNWIQKKVAINDGWHHVATTFNKDLAGTDKVKLYVDGVEGGTASSLGITTVIGTNNFPLRIGAASNATPTYFFNGNIADAHIYDRSLSATEILSRYNGADIPGAIGYWPLSSGAGDVSGNGHNGTVSGATLVGEAASFDGGVGSGDMITLENPLEIDLTSFALGFWVKRDSLISADGTNTSSFLRILEEGQYYKFLDYGIAEGKFKFHGERDQNSAYWASVTTNVVADTEWHYVFISGENNVVDVYMDGVYQGTDDDSAAGYTSNICTISSIGKGYSAANASYGSYFAGEIKDLKYYDRPLSVTEIQSLYDQGHSKPKQATIGNLNKGLVGHWPLKSKYEKTGENMLTNFSFETGDMTSWTNGSADYSVVTDEVKYGKYALKGVHDGSIEKPMAGQSFPVEIGKIYMISAWIKSDLTAGIHYLTTEGAIGGTVEKSISGTTDWTFVQKTGTAVTTTLNVYVYPHGYPIGTTWTDMISVKEVNLTADTTPQSNHGYVYGATVETGYTAFDGVNDYMKVTSFEATESFTFSAWVNPDRVTGDTNYFFEAASGSTALRFSFASSVCNIRIRDTNGDYSNRRLYSSATQSVWTHVVATFDKKSGVMKGYKNGELEESHSDVLLWGDFSGPLYFGFNNTNTAYFDGSLSDISIYNRPLSDREVKMLYDKGR